MQNYIPKTEDIKILAEAVKTAYLVFDREDWCDDGENICQGGKIKCNNCICYDNLIKAYKIAKNIMEG